MSAAPGNPRLGDAFGASLLAHRDGRDGTQVLERDDGLVEVHDVSVYFAPPDEWPPLDQVALARAAGRVLDAGAGAGRHALELQRRGHEVLAIDTSPGAVAVCRSRGVANALVASVVEPGAIPGRFETILLLGRNLGILGSHDHARHMFDAMRSVLAPGGLAVGTCLDPGTTDDPTHLAYQRANIARDRPPGLATIRVRYRELASPWFDWLLLAPAELAALARESGWSVIEATDPDPTYLAVLSPD